MRYSVYDHGTRVYNYFEDQRPEGTHASAPPKVALGGVATGKQGAIGVVPEAATWRLPWGAKKVGAGPLPKGRIASVGGAAMGDVNLEIPLGFVVALGFGYLAWRTLR